MQHRPSCGGGAGGRGGRGVYTSCPFRRPGRAPFLQNTRGGGGGGCVHRPYPLFVGGSHRPFVCGGETEALDPGQRRGFGGSAGVPRRRWTPPPLPLAHRRGGPRRRERGIDAIFPLTPDGPRPSVTRRPVPRPPSLAGREDDRPGTPNPGIRTNDHRARQSCAPPSLSLAVSRVLGVPDPHRGSTRAGDRCTTRRVLFPSGRSGLSTSRQRTALQAVGTPPPPGGCGARPFR